MEQQPVWTPHQLITGAAFRILKPLTSRGVTLNKGDMLPADAEVRQNPRRLATLCKTRFIEAVMAQSEAAAFEPAAVPVDQPRPQDQYNPDDDDDDDDEEDPDDEDNEDDRLAAKVKVPDAVRRGRKKSK